MWLFDNYWLRWFIIMHIQLEISNAIGLGKCEDLQKDYRHGRPMVLTS